MTKTHSRTRAVLIALTLGAASSVAAPAAFAEKDPVYTGRFSNTALGGYDALTYFDGAPAEGDKAFSTVYKGAEFLFASQDNLEKFLADPDAYEPQYGGYCAWAMAQGKFAKGDPRYWRIVDGKLYLNFNKGIQAKWEKDIPGFIEKADAEWPDVLTD